MNKGFDLSKLVQNISKSRPEISAKTSAIYCKVYENFTERNIDKLNECLKKLYVFAIDNYVDSDEVFEKYNDYPNEIKESIIAFLANVFQNQNTTMLQCIREIGIIQVICNMINNENNLIIPILQCLINISSDSLVMRDEVICCIDFNVLKEFVLIKNKYVSKLAVHLFETFCQYPIDKNYSNQFMNQYCIAMKN